MSLNQSNTADALETADSVQQLATAAIERAQKPQGSVSKSLREAAKAPGTADVAAIWIPADRIKPNRFAAQGAPASTDKKFEQLVKDIGLQGGNVQAIKVRPVRGHPDVDYELVYGNRRHSACLRLGLAVLAVVEELSDQDLFVQALRENSNRSQELPYVRGLMFDLALKGNLFPSVPKMAEASNLDDSLIYKLLKLARLPDVVVKAFPSPSKIQASWGCGLGNAWTRNQEKVRETALRIAQSGYPQDAKQVYVELTRCVEPDAAPREPTSEWPIRRGNEVVGQMSVQPAAEGGGIVIHLVEGAVEPDAVYQVLMRAVGRHKPPALEAANKGA